MKKLLIAKRPAQNRLVFRGGGNSRPARQANIMLITPQRAENALKDKSEKLNILHHKCKNI